MNILYFYMFYDIYDLSLFISVRAFVPSLRVLKTSQEREEMIRMVRVIKETRVISMLLVNLPEFFLSL